jgi:hypothetical protein
VNRGSRKRLHPGSAKNFPADTVHDRIARALCEAYCLPRKEFFESWSFVNRIRRRIDATVVWDLCAGHGLVSFLLALLEPQLTSLKAIDMRKPLSFERIRAALAPLDEERVAKVVFEERALEDLEPPRERVFMTAVHACGRRSDRAIELAIASHSSIALLPCCQDVAAIEIPDAVLQRWSKRDSVDMARIFTLHRAGYRTVSSKVDDDVTHCADAIIGLAPE